jgi:hypothetical protein
MPKEQRESKDPEVQGRDNADIGDLHELEDDESLDGLSSLQENQSRTKSTGDATEGYGRKRRMTEEQLTRRLQRKDNYTKRLILHALYVHRQLTLMQMHTLMFYESSIHRTTTAIETLEQIGLIQVAGETRKKPYHYRLSPMGLRVYAQVCMKIETLYDDPYLPKQHFLHGDLLIRSQENHHFLTQSFVTEVIGRMFHEGKCIPSCEWRRYVFFDQEGNVPYKPDWVFFGENTFYTELVNSDRLGEDVLNIPTLSRIEEDLQILREHYSPLISLETDTGSMKAMKIKAKIQRIQNARSFIPKCVAIFSNSEEARVQTITDAVEQEMSKDLLNDNMVFLIGKSEQLSLSVIYYVTLVGQLNTRFHSVLSDWKLHFPHYSQMSERDWAQKGVEEGYPDLSLIDNRSGNIVGIFFAMPCWINPHTKLAHMKRSYGDKISFTPILMYEYYHFFDQDSHKSYTKPIKREFIGRSDPLKRDQIAKDRHVIFMNLEDWQQGTPKCYEQLYERRKGYQWMEVGPWPY